MYTGEPVSGETLLGLSQAVAHIQGYQGMGHAFTIFDYDRNSGAAHAGDLLRQDPAGVNQTGLVVPWTSHPLATHVAVWIQFQGYARTGSSSAPQIDVYLETVAGAALDDPGGGPGVTISGAMLEDIRPRGYLIRGAATTIYPIRTVGLVRQVPTPGAFPTDPRQLELTGITGTPTRVQVRVVTQDVRVVRIDVQEWPRAVVEQ